LGESTNYISTVDAEGVALSAIQELYHRTQQPSPAPDRTVLEQRLVLANTTSIISLLIALIALWKARRRSA
jgi:hypothetical protein